MEVAGDRAALLGRNPQVRASSIEDDLEGLWRSSNGDLGEICDNISDGIAFEFKLILH